MACTDVEQFIKKLQQFSQKGTHPFKAQEDILKTALWIFRYRDHMNHTRTAKLDDSPSLPKAFTERKAVQVFHRCLNATTGSLPIITAFQSFHFNSVEKEIVLLLIIAYLGMLKNIDASEDIQRYINKQSVKRAMAVSKALSQQGRLIKSRVIRKNAKIVLSEDFVASIITKKQTFNSGWVVKSYDDLLDHTFALVRDAQLRAEALGELQKLGCGESEIAEVSENIHECMLQLDRTLEMHPSWKLNVIRESDLMLSERLMVYVLMGKDLGFFSPHDELFTGIGLARCASTDIPSVRHKLGLLKQDRSLRKDGYIRICGGASDNRAIEDEETLKNCEFELTSKFLKTINVKRCRKTGNSARKPIFKFDHLVLSDKIQSSLKICLTQARSHHILFEEWGLEKTITYGTGITLLFSGTSGTGKTACAEAIADELDKMIIAVNYAEIQDCWVGQTEKNIVRIFREASETDAVLFWDEADAMFYNRDTAVRNFEVRDVNVLLQELERFAGVCILSTNRKIYLDKALERRISMKIEFDRPNREIRRKIWQKLIPKEMPLGKDVSLDELSHEDLCGGEIKNVILNAARIALTNNNNGVCRKDIVEAIQMEREGRWSGSHETFGFRAT
ncbi:ATP-binding protein [bacterium]|nr:ATP-binding protein [candidate division CSSED10-310 bacterium]